MEFKVTHKFVRVSPRKLRLVAEAVRKLSPVNALEVLPHLEKKAAKPLIKAINAAVANAREKSVSDNDLTFKEIQIGDGPALKRGKPVARGMWHPYKRRMSQIRIVLKARDDQQVKNVAGKKTGKGKEMKKLPKGKSNTKKSKKHDKKKQTKKRGGKS